MTHTILIDNFAFMTRAALLDADNRLVELCLCDSTVRTALSGAIYKGRVSAVNLALGIAFVDLGFGLPAVLQGRAGQPLGVKENAEVLVEVKRPAYGHKGPTVTQDIGLGGEYLILLPKGKRAFVSQKLDPAVRRSLLDWTERQPQDMGRILRTAAAGVSEEALAEEEATLRLRWRELEQLAASTPAPAALYMPDIMKETVSRWLATESVGRAVSNNALWTKCLQIFPELEYNIGHFTGYAPPAEFNLETQIESALEPRMVTPEGISLMIETTESLTTIDVNSGTYAGRNFEDTALRVNLRAAEEIARQLRLRCIGGLVVIDFIDMRREEHRAKVWQKLQACLKRDFAQIVLDKFTLTGLVTLKRSRTQTSWQSHYLEKCPRCGNGLQKNAYFYARHILREICTLPEHAPHFTIMMHPGLADFFTGAGQPLLMEMERLCSATICVVPMSGLAKGTYQIRQIAANT